MQKEKQQQVVERNYTKIPNPFLEKLPFLDITGAELMVLLYIWRRTLGFNKVSEYLSANMISTATRYCQRTVIRCIQELAGRNVISIEKDKNYWKHRPNKIVIHDITEWTFPKAVRENNDSKHESDCELQARGEETGLRESEVEILVGMMDEEEGGEAYECEGGILTGMSHVIGQTAPDQDVECSSDGEDCCDLTGMSVRNTVFKERNIQKNRKRRPSDGFLSVCDSKGNHAPDNMRKAMNPVEALPQKKETKRALAHFDEELKGAAREKIIIRECIDVIHEGIVTRDYYERGVPLKQWEWLLVNNLFPRHMDKVNRLAAMGVRF